MSHALRLDPDLTCDTCGCFGAYRFEVDALCADCYSNRGACCSPEFSGEAAAPRVTRCETPPPSKTASPQES